jgi:hypothetical protein
VDATQSSVVVGEHHGRVGYLRDLGSGVGEALRERSHVEVVMQRVGKRRDLRRQLLPAEVGHRISLCVVLCSAS